MCVEIDPALQALKSVHVLQVHQPYIHSFNEEEKKTPFVRSHPHGREWETHLSSNPCIHLFIHPSRGLWLALSPGGVRTG